MTMPDAMRVLRRACVLAQRARDNMRAGSRTVVAIVIAISGGWVAGIPLAMAQEAPSGETLFRTYCASCHVDGGSRAGEALPGNSGNAAAIRAAMRRVDAMRALDGVVGTAEIDAIAAYLAQRAGSTDKNIVYGVEYYHAWFDHYFITAVPDEIARLDDGAIEGWVRTGRRFKVYALPGTGLSPVCRFFSNAFDAKSSHFYTSSASECLVVKANTKWRYEGVAFHVAVPRLDGTCPPATNPVYRLYNASHGGAPNHRLTTDLGIRERMIGQGWAPEGQGTLGVSMCIPR
jgi:mono/diheme cytochrome c family protein